MTIFKLNAARIRRSVLATLENHEPLTLHEIAYSIIRRDHMHPSREQITTAIAELRDEGYGIREHDDSVQVTYWLRGSGEAA